MNTFFQPGTFRTFLAILIFLAIMTIVYFIYRKTINIFKKKTDLYPGFIDRKILGLIQTPALVLLYCVLMKIFIVLFLLHSDLFPYLNHLITLFFIFSMTWLIIRTINAFVYYLQSRIKINITNNLHARKNLTQINVFKNITTSVISIIALSIGLLTFQEARTIGLSLLTSAGILGIIVGFAAQKSIGMILAGIQLAITQPIRLDDVVVVEGEWGRIEEFTLTYIVVKIWDERRLILPVTYFLEKPFQNWTRNTADIIGTVFIMVDYNFPVDCIREVLPSFLNHNPNWDQRLWNVQVTNLTDHYKEIRILVSSSDSAKNWDLRADIRERLIDYINEHFPETFAKIRIKTTR